MEADVVVMNMHQSGKVRQRTLSATEGALGCVEPTIVSPTSGGSSAFFEADAATLPSSTLDEPPSSHFRIAWSDFDVTSSLLDPISLPFTECVTIAALSLFSFIVLNDMAGVLCTTSFLSNGDGDLGAPVK